MRFFSCLVSLLALLLEGCTLSAAGTGDTQPGAGDDSSSDDGGDDGGGPNGTPDSCSSGVRWAGGWQGSPDMMPGSACIACHLSDWRSPSLSVAGTLFANAREPDDCQGVGDAKIEITDAAGQVTTIPIRDSGNFFTSRWITFPIRAKVIQGDRAVEMATPVYSGDCNSCHTQDGGSPGRILPPR